MNLTVQKLTKYHVTCLSKWLYKNNMCPMCIQVLTQPSISQPSAFTLRQLLPSFLYPVEIISTFVSDELAEEIMESVEEISNNYIEHIGV